MKTTIGTTDQARHRINRVVGIISKDVQTVVLLASIMLDVECILHYLCRPLDHISFDQIKI
eukprot:scaffold665641_cov73-Prasinocladus_malaysianus.AAC.1